MAQSDKKGRGYTPHINKKILDAFFNGCPDYCQICGAYDTIQVYIRSGNNIIHICENCNDKLSENAK